MVSTKYKRKRADRRLRSLARIVLATCVSVACIMLGSLSIKLFVSGIFFKGVENVSAEVKKVEVNIPDLTKEKVQCLFESGFNLFKESAREGESSLIAPYATLMHLGMLENGAVGDTLDEIQAFLGQFSMSEINETYGSLQQKLKSYTNLTFCMKNSIWLKRYEDDLPKDYFLKVNATYYGADLFVADLTKEHTLNKMNEWVAANTAHKFINPIKSISDETAIYLLSSLDFKASWLTPYGTSDLLGGEFKLTNGDKKSVKYMYSKENYLEGEDVEGFIKPYTDNHCSFVAIRPTNGISIYEYVKDLDSTSFKNIIHSKSTQKAIVAIPKFTYESQINLNQSLQTLGVKTAFDATNADFSKIYEQAQEQLYLSEVVQKNYIQVDEVGTSSGAISGNKVNTTTSVEEDTQKSMIFNAPFLYAVIDNETKLPLLIGIMADPE